MRLKSLLLMVALCGLMLTAACGKPDYLKLTYAVGPKTDTACDASVVVFKFKDSSHAEGGILGRDSDGHAIRTVTEVADWVGWALFDELEAAGSKPKYRTTTIDTDLPVVTGEVLQATLNQTGATTYAGKIAVRVEVRKDGKTVYAEKFISQVEDVAVIGYGSPADIMAEALRGLMAEAVPSVCANL